MANVEWGEYTYKDLFYDIPIKRKLDKTYFDTNGKTPVFSAESSNNGIMGYTNISADYITDNSTPLYIIFGDHTRNFNIATEDFCVADNVKILIPKIKLSIDTLLFITSAWKKCIPNKGYCRHWSIAQKVFFSLPTKNNQIDFDFMESFIAELEAERIAELEAERIAELEAYLSVTGLKDTQLTDDELNVLKTYPHLSWKEFNLEVLFGKSTRGKRLKSADRVSGSLPFVTAGEKDEGISAFIDNNVEVFSKNTTTIDMFGSAKYRNYDYGADDHIAVVHTEKLSKHAAIFVTAACHKSAHTGKFHYGNNFYAKDADKLYINLPEKNGDPDYEVMENLISAVQKFVIKDVVRYSDERIIATKKIVEA
ncbi:MAG: restriction endonuclease subunit S [Ruminococcus sp.]|nr:restriction endonuclease subunit S [Ruminococcus sp.]